MESCEGHLRGLIIRQVIFMRHFQSIDCGMLLKNHIGAPLNHFWTEGPNGRHLCLIEPLLGPRICSENNATIETENQIHKFRRENPSIHKDISFQISQGLYFLHSKGVCHGDLRPSNILMQYDES